MLITASRFIEWNPVLRTPLKCGHLHVYTYNNVDKNRPPEMRTPHYSVKQTLGLVPTVSPPKLILNSGQFGTNFIDSLVKQQEEL